MGSDIDNAQADNKIPLAIAARRGRAEAMNALVEFGANLKPQAEGPTILTFAGAAQEKHYTAADILQNAINLPGLLLSVNPSSDKSQDATSGGLCLWYIHGHETSCVFCWTVC